MFVTDTYYSLELGTEIIQFDDQGRVCGAQRRKFVKNQIKPKLRTSFEVSKWLLLKDSFRVILTEIKKVLKTCLKIKLGDRFLKQMSVNNRNVWNKYKWTRLKLFKIGNKTPSIYVKLLRHWKAVWRTCFLLTNQTLISMISMFTNIHF